MKPGPKIQDEHLGQFDVLTYLFINRKFASDILDIID